MHSTETWHPEHFYAPISRKSRLVAFLLAFFLGMFGAHRFYVGKTGTAIHKSIARPIGERSGALQSTAFGGSPAVAAL